MSQTGTILKWLVMVNQHQITPGAKIAGPIELCQGQAASAVMPRRVAPMPPSKINYPHSQFGMPCFERAERYP